ncbi:MAG: Mur ligase domain-containing protein, partial [Planctomycetota bacterium]
MIRWPLSRIAHELGTETPAGPNVAIAGVATDTRTPMPGALFVALRGERFDAHDYLEDAIERGACALLVDRHDDLPDRAPAIVVEDTA